MVKSGVAYGNATWTPNTISNYTGNTAAGDGAQFISKQSELFILYGRRGVGKSALLRQVLNSEGIPFLYYRAVRRTLPLQLAALTESFRATFPDVFLPQPFASTSFFLEALVYEAEARQQKGNKTPVCVVIDELPYLADVDAGLLTVLQHFWDDNNRRPNLKLFLAGSYLSFMELQVLDKNAPLYNRRTGAMKLEPMDYAEAALFSQTIPLKTRWLPMPCSGVCLPI